MAARLADYLQAAQKHFFVGRADECAVFSEALTETPPPFFVLHVYGPGGVGKSTLLKRYADLARAADWTPLYLDARIIDPTPTAFVEALRRLVGAEAGAETSAEPWEVLDATGTPHVLLIDTYETLAALDDWLRDTYLPQMPSHVLVVIAGRQPPATGWRTEPWQAVVRVVPLRNLREEESRAYLARRHVPEMQHDDVLSFTYGHPLALSLVADSAAQRPRDAIETPTSPDVIHALVRRFVQKVPSPAHRTALEACARVRYTTEPLLAAMLRVSDAHELFGWLQELSIMEAGPLGLFPHDLARDVLTADLRWRNPDWDRELHQRARRFYMARIEEDAGRGVRMPLVDYVYLHRDNPVVRPFFEQMQTDWNTRSGLRSEPAAEADWPVLQTMVEAHEGQASAGHAAHWFTRFPGRVLVFRNGEGAIDGFMLPLPLHEADPAELAADPATAAATEYLRQHAPLRPGEHATLFRFWMARDTYQDISAVQGLVFVQTVRHYLSTPNLAFTFLPCAAPDLWTIIFAYARINRLPAGDFTVGTQTYGMFGHDWRAEPPHRWLDQLAARSPTRQVEAAPDVAVTPMLLVLSEDDFAAAVKDALGHLMRPDALAANPLLRSRIVLDASAPEPDAADRVAALVEQLEAALDTLQEVPRDAKYYNVLYRCYVKPVGSQEQAAERLNMAYSTFRRYRKKGVARVTAYLWAREIGEV